MTTTPDPAADPAEPDDDDDDAFFWRIEDLLERRIVADRNDLFRKQVHRGFPRALKAIQSPNAISLFKRSAVKAWLRDNLKELEPIPPPPKQHTAGGLAAQPRPRGRPRKPRPGDQQAAAE